MGFIAERTATGYTVTDSPLMGTMRAVNDEDEVRCRRCNRILKNPKTRLAGIGKVCEGKEGAERVESSGLGPGKWTKAGYQTSYVDEDGQTYPPTDHDQHV